MDLKDEPPRKKKRNIEEDTPPPLPENAGMTHTLPPVPDEPHPQTQKFRSISESFTDGELDISALMNVPFVNSSQDSVDECILPTTPSLSDMLAQSDICGAISSSNTLQGERGSVADWSSLTNSSFHNEAEKNVATVNGHDEPASDQTDLHAEAHDLLDNFDSNTSFNTTLAESSSTENAATDNQPFVQCTRTIVRDIIPKYQLEVLPEGWKELVHESGLPLYCHLATRVVTWSRPYFLANRYAKTHAIPVGAVPCLAYRKAKEECEKAANGEKSDIRSAFTNDQTAENGRDNLISRSPNNTNNSEKNESSGGDEVTTNGTEKVPNKLPDLEKNDIINYCKNLFQFETLNYNRFTSWKDRKEYACEKKREKMLQQAKENKSVIIPSTELPEELQRDSRGKLKPDLVIIVGTRTVLEILVAYSTWALKKPPVYETKESPEGFLCNIKLNRSDVVYATGTGPNKRAAKDSAAAKAVELLLPKYSAQLLEGVLNTGTKGKDSSNLNEYYKIFDTMPITDTRIYDMSKTTNQVYAPVMLKTCIKRNFGMPEDEIKTEITVEQPGRFSVVTCEMSVAKFKAKVQGKNTKIATHLAAQHILKQLHPHLVMWGSILRLYGQFSDGGHVEHKQADAEECVGNSTFNLVPEESNQDIANMLLCKNGSHGMGDVSYSELNFVSTKPEIQPAVANMCHCDPMDVSSGTNDCTHVTDQSIQTEESGIHYFLVKKTSDPVVILEEGVMHDKFSSGNYVLMANNSTQTGVECITSYHKATQIPEMSYNPYTNKNIVKPEVMQTQLEIKTEKMEPSIAANELKMPAVIPASTQTDMAGYLQLHKATQYPDKDYPDPGHPPPILPSILLTEQHLLSAQLAAAQQQQQQQLYLQQQLQYSYIDSNTGLPMLPYSQPYVHPQSWPYAPYTMYPGYDQI